MPAARRHPGDAPAAVVRAYRKGFKAALCGRPRDSNPYRNRESKRPGWMLPWHVLCDAWDFGHHEGDRGKLPQFGFPQSRL